MSNGLAPIGIDEFEENVYEALLEDPCVHVETLGERMGTDEAAVRDALEALARKGLLVPTPRFPSGYGATDPEIAVEILALEARAAVDRARLNRQRLAALYRRSMIRELTRHPVSIVEGRDEVLATLASVFSSPREELLLFERPLPDLPGAKRIGVSETPPAGVSTRIVLDPTAAARQARIDQAQKEHELGVQLRVAHVSSQLAIVDRRWAMLPLEHEDSPGAIALMVATPGSVLAALLELFETVWERAAPLPLGEDERGRARNGRRRDLQILSLLVQGMTEAAVARQLEIGTRTVQRRLEALMKQLGARNRLQLVLEAARRGLL